MSVEQLLTLSKVSYVIAIVLFVTAIVLFFLLDVRGLIDDLRGFTRKKGNKAIESGESADKAKAKKHVANLTPTGSLKKNHSGGLSSSELVASSSPETAEMIAPSADTTALGGGYAATTLLENQPQPVAAEAPQTTVLTAEPSQTTVLTSDTAPSPITTILFAPQAETAKEQSSEDFVFEILEEFYFTSSPELIE